jgi:Ca-activated chloride channel family protein
MTTTGVPTSQIRRHRHRTGLVFAATAAVVTVAAFMTPKRISKPVRKANSHLAAPLLTADGLSARLPSSHLLLGDSDTFVAITMKAPDGAARARAPASVAIVLDTSGSMGDENRLEDAKRAAYSLLDRLAPDDELALVTYATSAELVLPLSRADEDTRARARRAIAGMQPTGGTNISGGLGLGADALAGAHSTLRRIVLISDGEPTEGLGSGIAVDPRPLVDFAGRRATEGTSITTVGVGLTFREDIMAGIAGAGRGNYYFVERAADLSDMFARELGRLGETVYTAGALTLQPAAGVELLEAIGYPLVQDRGGLRVPVADLRRGEQRKVVVRVRVHATAETDAILGVTWRYRTLDGAGQEQRVVAHATVTADPTLVERGRDKVAAELIEQVRTGQALEQASAAYARGDGAAASQILVERRAVMEALEPGLDEALVRDLQEATERAERGFAEAPGAGAPEGKRALKVLSAETYDLLR